MCACVFFFKLRKDASDVVIKKINEYKWRFGFVFAQHVLLLSVIAPASLGHHSFAERRTFRKILECAEFTQQD